MKRSCLVIAVFAALALMTASAQADGRGGNIFRQKCTMCHVVNGKGGQIGPDLSRIAAAMKDTDIKLKLENPRKRNPSSSMPSFKSLPKADMDALLEYLKTLK